MKIEILQRNKLFSCTMVLFAGLKDRSLCFLYIMLWMVSIICLQNVFLGSGVVKRSLKNNFKTYKTPLHLIYNDKTYVDFFIFLNQSLLA